MGCKESNQTKSSSADNLHKQFGPRPDPTKHWFDLDPNCLTESVFDGTCTYIPEIFCFEKVNFEKICRQKNCEIYPACIINCY